MDFGTWERSLSDWSEALNKLGLEWWDVWGQMDGVDVE